MMTIGFYTGAGQDYSGPLSNGAGDTEGGSYGLLDPTTAAAGQQYAIGDTYGNPLSGQATAYDTSQYSSPILAYLDSLGGQNGQTSKGLASTVTSLGLDPTAVQQGLQAWSGSNPSNNINWLGSPEAYLQAAAEGNPSLAGVINPYLAQNQGAEQTGQEETALATEQQHSPQSMHSGDYASIAEGLGTIAGAGALGGAFASGGITSGLSSGAIATGAEAAPGLSAGGAYGGLEGAGLDQAIAAAGAAPAAAAPGASTFVPALANASDPIEAINTAMNLTGAQTATQAAQALGYSSPESMLNAINPAWSSGAASGAGIASLGQDTGGAASAPSSTPSTPSTSAPNVGGVTGNGTSSPNLFQMLSQMGNGVSPSDIFNLLKANGTAGSLIGGGGPISTLANLGSSLYGIYNSEQTKKLAQNAASNADPLGPYRAGYAQQLSSLMANPSSVTGLPGYQAGLQAVERSGAANGYLGSGNMMAALQQYGGTAYQNQVNTLAGLAGGNPGQAASLSLQGNIAGNQTLASSLAALGYGTRLLGI